MKTPITGITKKPRMPSATPAHCVEAGTPTVFRRRPGTAYLTTVPTTSRNAATPNTVHPVPVPTSAAHRRTASRTSTVPGRIGTRIPTMPTTIATATSTSVRLTAATLSQRRPVPGFRNPRRPTAPDQWSGAVLCLGVGRCRSALALGSAGGRVGEPVGLVDHVGGDGLEGVAVLTGVVRAEVQLATTEELDLQVGLRPAAVAAVGRAQRGSTWGNGSGHFGLISTHRCLAQRSHRSKDSLFRCLATWCRTRPLKHAGSIRLSLFLIRRNVHPWMGVPPLRSLPTSS